MQDVVKATASHLLEAHNVFRISLLIISSVYICDLHFMENVITIFTEVCGLSLGVCARLDICACACLCLYLYLYRFACVFMNLK